MHIIIYYVAFAYMPMVCVHNIIVAQLFAQMGS